MRTYYIPASAGVLLVVSAFLPWMRVGNVALGGVPETVGVWILGLGGLAILLAGRSIRTRKNSRHPLLLVGLAAFAIMFLGYQWMSRTVRDAAWAQAQASAIVSGLPAGAAPETAVGLGIYLGLVGATVLVLFGLTIVVKRVPSAYAVPEDDDTPFTQCPESRVQSPESDEDGSGGREGRAQSLFPLPVEQRENRAFVELNGVVVDVQ